MFSFFLYLCLYLSLHSDMLCPTGRVDCGLPLMTPVISLTENTMVSSEWLHVWPYASLLSKMLLVPLRWLCSPKSPCGELLPVNGAPEYYILLEASNLCEYQDSSPPLKFVMSFSLFKLTHPNMAAAHSQALIVAVCLSVCFPPLFWRGVGMNVTYCNYTVQFLVRVHGLGMGMTATVTSFLVSGIIMINV